MHNINNYSIQNAQLFGKLCLPCSHYTSKLHRHIRVGNAHNTVYIFPYLFTDPMEVEIKCQTSSSRPHCTSTTTTLTTSTRDRLCVACLQPICDRYMMRVADEYYHENTCLKCTSCSIPLKHSCFTRNGKLYCRIDYER